MDRRSLAICAIFKNEASYLLEWIAYHHAIGFDRFVLYDNGSTDGGADLIRSSPLADRVTVIHWPQRPGQLTAYRHFIDIFAPAYDWAAFIDLDEFILPLDGITLQDTLQRCAQASAVLVNWRVFGPAGHEEPAAGLVIEAYDLRAEDCLPVNRHVKSIVRCADLLDVTQNPHEFRLKGPVCNPLGQTVPNIAVQQAACHQALVINHYYTKSRREWLAKVHRGSAMFDYTGPKYTEDVFDHLAAACQVKDEAIKAYVPHVRAMLAGSSIGSGAPLPESLAPPPATAAQAEPVAALTSMPAPEFTPVEPSVALATPIGLATVGGSSVSAEAAAGLVPPAPAGLAASATATPQPPPEAVPAIPNPLSVTEGGAALPSAPTQPVMSAPEWLPAGDDAQQRAGGLALVFRDRSRSAAPWLAALRGKAVGQIDPEFLLDEVGRLRDFPSDREARAACDAVLAEYQLG